MSTYTPGPWQFHEQGEANDYCLLVNKRRWVISFRQNGELMPVEQQANAQLISQSPAMLELLEEATEYEAENFDDDESVSGADLVEWFAEWRLRAKEVIAQARMNTSETSGTPD